MCGIAGLLNTSGESVIRDRVRAMCELMHHRGPDQEGVWNDGFVALGHQRLSIIDLSSRAGNPMPNEDETLWLTCNGEIYNFRELRLGLKSKGHRFRSETDTEVILHSYEDEGVEAIKKLNGMFAFGLWDAVKRRLVLARDRFGIKPLYYVQLAETLAFASEIKAFLALPEFQVRVNLKALSEHLSFQNCFGDRTFFEGVKLLPAGHYLICENGKISVQQYWDLRFESVSEKSFEETAGELKQYFHQAVERQLVSDVPLGCYLSGGMDTGAISAVASRKNPDMHTFTCGFKLDSGMSELEQCFDESKESHRLSQLLGSQHHEIQLGPEAMDRAIASVVWHLDEPRVGISYQVYYTTRMIHQYVKVVLSGVGGDELFAGYPWRYNFDLDVEDSDFEENYYRSSLRFLKDDEKQHFFTGEIAKELKDFSSFEVLRKILRQVGKVDFLHRALYFDFKTFMPGLLIVDDKLSMAHSVEARVPFLDNDLVDYVSRIPASYKYRDGQSKAILKMAMRGLIPEDTLRRRKQGFTPPDKTWYSGPNRAYVEDIILGPRALSRGYFEPQEVRRIFQEHLTGVHNHRFLLWSLMCFEWWNRLFVDRDPLQETIDCSLKESLS